MECSKAICSKKGCKNVKQRDGTEGDPCKIKKLNLTEKAIMNSKN